MGSAVNPVFEVSPPTATPKFEVEPPAPKEAQPGGFWHELIGTVGDSLRGLFTGPGVGTPEWTIKAATQAALADQARKEAGYGKPYRATAFVGENLLGIPASRMEAAAARGDTAGVLGAAVVPTALTLAGPLAEGVGKIRAAGKLSEMGEAPKVTSATPVAKPAAEPAATAGAAENKGPAFSGGLAERLGIVDPAPESLMTRAVKPLASNNGWDKALARAMPDMKAAEASTGPITGVDDALGATAAAKKALWAQYEQKLKSVSPVMDRPNPSNLVSVERYSAPGKESGYFYAPEGEAAQEFGPVLSRAKLDISKFYKGTDSGSYLESIGKFDDPIPSRLQAEAQAAVDEARKTWPKDTAGFAKNPKTIRQLADYEGMIDASSLFDAKQSTAAKYLQDKGFQGAYWSEEDDLNPHQYQVFDKSSLKPSNISEIDGNSIADAMIKSIDKRTAAQNPVLVKQINAAADTYRRPFTVSEAEDFLQSVNNELHSYYAKNKVGQQVAARDPATGHVVAEANALRDALYSKLDELTGPGAADLKQRYGALSNVEGELLRRKNVAARQQPMSLVEQMVAANSGLGDLISPGKLLNRAQNLAVARWLKEYGSADSMIKRAFEKFSGATQPARAAGPRAVPPLVAPAAPGQEATQ